MIILAHRGWWLRPDEKNRLVAFERAFAAGHGVETDLRDHDGEVIVSHDPPIGRSQLKLDQLLACYAAMGQPGRLALNIKADGLQGLIAEALTRHGIKRAFLFDMAVPDAIVSLRRGLPCFTRESEYEQHPSFIERARGVWMDAFERDWIDAASIRDRLSAGLNVALVSPELHGREPLSAWQAWASAPHAQLEPCVMLCTDRPDTAEAFFASAPAADMASEDR